MEAASVLLELEVQEDFLTVRGAGVVEVEVLAVKELEVGDTLQSAVEEEVSGGAAGARILSSVAVVGVGAGPRPGLAAAGSVVAESTVCTAGLLQPSPGGCSLHCSTFQSNISTLHSVQLN